MIIKAAKVALRGSRKARIKDPEILPLLKKKWKRASLSYSCCCKPKVAGA
jgi:hypothetical protein